MKDIDVEGYVDSSSNVTKLDLDQMSNYELIESNTKVLNIKKQIANAELEIYNESTK